MENHLSPSLISKVKILTLALLFLLSLWWLWTVLFVGVGGYESLLWAASYQSVALLGSLVGFSISSSWGGFKSLLGRAVGFLSLGLLFQVIGQSVFSFYNLFLHVEVPYPSIADIGFFGSIVWYIIAIFLIGKVAGIHLNTKNVASKIQVVAIPAFMLLSSYFVFLGNYEFDFSNILRVFLDFAYPLGEAVYLSIAILIITLSRGFLGGVMKKPLLIIALAFVFQYIAEFNFLYQVIHKSWINGGYGDYLYLLSYFVMSIGLLSLGESFSSIYSQKQDQV